jgi:hypothetical protein
MRKLPIFFVLLLLLSGCGAENLASAPPAVPSDWHVLPENLPAGEIPVAESESETEARLAPSLDAFFESTGEALDGTTEAPGTRALGVPKDLAPWHAEYFMTDLGLTASGRIGALVLKGSPAVNVYWRKKPAQAPAPDAEPVPAPADALPSAAIDAQATPEDIARELEPSVRAALASGRIDDEGALRRSLLESALELQSLGRALGANPGLGWWPTRVRLDLIAEASGKVLPAPVVNVGGEARFRLEWHRIMRAAPAGGGPRPAPALTERGERFRELVSTLALDLEALSEETDKLEGFKAYSFRVGIGASAGAKLGIVKGSASLLAIVYFGRDVAKPKISPKDALRLAAPATIPLIVDQPSDSGLRFAAARGIGFERSGRDAVFAVDREQFRKGLRKAAKLGRFFAKRAKKAKGGSWRIYEMRTGFDMSVTGTVGLVDLGGLATSEINFYNMGF